MKTRVLPAGYVRLSDALELDRLSWGREVAVEPLSGGERQQLRELMRSWGEAEEAIRRRSGRGLLGRVPDLASAGTAFVRFDNLGGFDRFSALALRQLLGGPQKRVVRKLFAQLLASELIRACLLVHKTGKLLPLTPQFWLSDEGTLAWGARDVSWSREAGAPDPTVTGTVIVAQDEIKGFFASGDPDLAPRQDEHKRDWVTRRLKIGDLRKIDMVEARKLAAEWLAHRRAPATPEDVTREARRLASLMRHATRAK